MKAYVITIKGQQDDQVSNLKQSIVDTESDIELHEFDAVVPETVESDMHRFVYFNRADFKWTWPTSPDQDHLDLKTGLYKFCYDAQNQDKKVACSLSHMLLWDKCVVNNEPIIIFESDAYVTRQFDTSEFDTAKVCGLNDPRKATRRANIFDEKASSKFGLQSVPTVNRIGEQPVPQGLAGHSSYYITPEGAKELLDKVREYGMWPNDAYVCKELFPWIRVVYPYFTRVQDTESTTTR